MRRMSPSELQASDAIVVDVREYPEYARGAIPGARPAPLSTLEAAISSWDRSMRYVMVCKSGKRSEQAAQRLMSAGFSAIAILDGGTEAWIASGFDVQVSEKSPWSLERQVRIAAGGMVLVSALLGITLSPWFFVWTMFVGAGLVFAGLTDTCMLASVLGRMPWNRAPRTTSSCSA